MSTTPYTVVLRKNPNQDSFGIYIGEDVPSGVYIVTVEPNTSAANSNIQPGDRILAVNGQLISSMTMNPREMVTQIASKAESLTLYMEPSDLLQSLDISLNNNFSNNKTFDLPSSNNFSLNKTFDLLSRNNFSNNNNYQYVSEESNGIDRELEKYFLFII
jgi:predicted metalloprotease with PDZ domain